MEEEVSKITLPNGVRILCEHVPLARSVSMGIFMGIGSRDDPPAEGGVAHYIEHMLFKGTSKRSARQISEEIDEIGGQLNAFTAKEHTCVYARVLDEDFSVAADVVTDMVTSSLFQASDVELERTVLLDEISTYEDAPDELVLDLLENAIWDGYQLGNPILGTIQTVTQMKRDRIVEYFRERYTADKFIVTVAGSVGMERVIDQLAGSLSTLLPGREPSPEPPVEVKRNVRVKPKQVEQVHFCLGRGGLRAGDPKSYVMNVLDNVLGGGPSSRLFQKVREERGLAYEVYSFHSGFRDTGVFGVYAASKPSLAREVKDILEQEMADMASHECDEREVLRAKRQIKSSLVLGLESTSSRMMRLGRSELVLGRVVPVSEVVNGIDRVTPQDVLNLAGEVLRLEEMSFAGVGADVADIERLITPSTRPAGYETGRV
jgi:predicted Zn-dependent peptidase